MSLAHTTERCSTNVITTVRQFINYYWIQEDRSGAGRSGKDLFRGLFRGRTVQGKVVEVTFRRAGQETAAVARGKHPY